MVDRFATEIDACQIHLALLVYARADVAALDVTFDGLLLGDVVAYFVIGGILLEVKAFFHPFQFLLLDRNQAVAESQVAFRFFLFYLAHQCQAFPNHLELFRVQDADTVYFTLGGKELILFIHVSGTVQPCLCILFVIAATGQCYGCKRYTDC